MKLYSKKYLLNGVALLAIGVFFMFLPTDPKSIIANFNLIWGLSITAGCVMILRSFLDPNERPPRDA